MDYVHCFLCSKSLTSGVVCADCQRDIYLDKYGNWLEPQMVRDTGYKYGLKWIEEMWLVRVLNRTGFHRLDGPAYTEWVDGIIKEQQWCISGKFHRLDGPAIRTRESSVNLDIWWERYFINDVEYTYKNWKEKIKELNK